VIVTTVPLTVAVIGDRPESSSNSVPVTTDSNPKGEYVVLGNVSLVADDPSVVYADSSPA
jgi:hypothetical protein